MKKLIIFVVIIIVIGINFQNKNNSSNNKTVIKKQNNYPIIEDKIEKEDILENEQNLNISKIDINNKKELDEILTLLKKAEMLLQNSKDEDALEIYNTIIEKTSSTSDPLMEEYFVTAATSKAYIYQVYPYIDHDAAIETYNLIIKKFEKSNSIKHIQYYIDAKIQLSYILPEDEKIETYNELIAKFEKSTNLKIKEKIESVLITKSFQLIGKNDEEAMQILDRVIERYQEESATSIIPENIKYSILNNIELALITNNESDDYVELAKKFMSNSPDTKPLLEMLEIIKNAQYLNQDEALAAWKEEHGDYRFPDWSFQEIERWAYQIEDKETKDRVSKYINSFVNQKYNIPNQYQYNNNTTYNNLKNSYNEESYLEDEIETNEYKEDEPYYEKYDEPNPYREEILETTKKYSDPYY